MAVIHMLLSIPVGQANAPSPEADGIAHHRVAVLLGCATSVREDGYAPEDLKLLLCLHLLLHTIVFSDGLDSTSGEFNGILGNSHSRRHYHGVL